MLVCFEESVIVLFQYTSVLSDQCLSRCFSIIPSLVFICFRLKETLTMVMLLSVMFIDLICVVVIHLKTPLEISIWELS